MRIPSIISLLGAFACLALHVPIASAQQPIYPTTLNAQSPRRRR